MERTTAISGTANPSPGFRQNPGRRITVQTYGGVVNVTFADAVVASTDNALVLREQEYPAVFYIPFEDIYFELMNRSDTTTHCPYKGNASYWNVAAGGKAETDVMWAYEHPYDEMLPIRNHGAFYLTKVRIDAQPELRRIDANL